MIENNKNKQNSEEAHPDADLSKFIHLTRLKEHVLNTRNISKSCVAC